MSLATNSFVSDEPQEVPSFNAATLFFLQLGVCVLAGHFAHRTKFKYATEGSLALLVGMITGGLVFCYVTFVADTPPALVFSFRTDVFFNVLLPPIIFNCGFSVKKKLFFANFFTLAIFGIIGTFMSVTIVAAGCQVLLYWTGMWGVEANAGSDHHTIALGTILSSTDSVATLQVLKPDVYPVLHALVFGEGVVNDATSLVILRALDTIKAGDPASLQGITLFLLRFCYLFVASLVLGVMIGMFSALLIRHAFATKAHSTDSEVLITFLLAFLAYSLAEAANLSGIFAVFFCGIAMSHWTWHSLSAAAKVVTVYLFRLLSFGMELFMFVYAGFDLLSLATTPDGADGSLILQALPLACGMLVLLMLARAVTIGSLTVLANRWRTKPIAWREAVAMWWAGSMRGAVSVAMTYHHYQQHPGRTLSEKQRVVETALILVVLMTTLGLSSFTKQFLEHLLPKHDQNMSHQDSLLSLMEPLHNQSLQEGLKKGLQPRDLQQRWRKWDRRYLQPLLGGRSMTKVEAHDGTLSPRGNLLSTAFHYHAPHSVGVRSHPALPGLISMAGPASSMAWLDEAHAEIFGAALGALDSMQLDVSVEQLAWLASHVAHSDGSRTAVERSIHQINQVGDRLAAEQANGDCENNISTMNGVAGHVDAVPSGATDATIGWNGMQSPQEVPRLERTLSRSASCRDRDRTAGLTTAILDELAGAIVLPIDETQLAVSLDDDEDGGD